MIANVLARITRRVVYTRIPDPMADAIEELADRYGVSMTAVFTRACAFYLQHATGRDYEASTLTLP